MKIPNAILKRTVTGIIVFGISTFGHIKRTETTAIIIYNQGLERTNNQLDPIMNLELEDLDPFEIQGI